jgi:hypothetical protein
VRALSDAKSRSNKDIENRGGLAPLEDIDAPLPDVMSQNLLDKFRTIYTIAFPSEMMPGPQVIARSYRERARSVYSPRDLKKVVNFFRMNFMSSRAKNVQQQVGTLQITHQEDPSKNAEVAILNIFDALDRIWLLCLSWAIIGWDEHTNAAGTKGTWFSLTDVFEHVNYLRSKAFGGTLSSTTTFLEREMAIRNDAITHLQGPEKLSMGEALKRARHEKADRWMNLYSRPDGDGAQLPLYVNPLKTAINASMAAGAGSGNRIRTGGTTGVGRASLPEEITPDHKQASFRNGCKAYKGTLPGGGPLCNAFSSGRGCKNNACGGTHLCDIVSKNGQPCLGEHSRFNCPLKQ